MTRKRSPGCGCCMATLVGQVNGCSSQGFPGAAITIIDNVTTATLATTTCNAGGAYTVTFMLPANPRSIKVQAKPTGTFASRFVSSVTTTLSVATGTHTVSTLTLNPGSNTCCVPAQYFPNLFSQQLCVTVTDSCTGSPISGAAVSVPGGFGSPSLPPSTTTDGSGVGCITATVPGTYTLLVAATGYSSITFTETIACGSDASSSRGLTPTTGAVTVTTGICAPLDGFLVEVKQGGVTIASGTTDATGHITFTGIPLHISTSFTSSKTGVNTNTVTTTLPNIGACATSLVTVPVTVASGYVCLCTGSSGGTVGLIPATTIQVTDNFYGITTTLTYNGSNGNFEGTSSSINFSCPLLCPDETGVLFYSYGPAGGSCGLTVEMHTFIPGGIWGTQVCPTGGTPNQAVIFAPPTSGTSSPWTAHCDPSATGGFGPTVPYCGGPPYTFDLTL